MISDLKTVRDAREEFNKAINNADFATPDGMILVDGWMHENSIKLIRAILDRMIETPAPTEKVERIEGLEEAIDDNKFMCGMDRRRILKKAARAYLKLQSATQED